MSRVKYIKIVSLKPYTYTHIHMRADTHTHAYAQTLTHTRNLVSYYNRGSGGKTFPKWWHLAHHSKPVGFLSTGWKAERGPRIDFLWWPMAIKSRVEIKLPLRMKIRVKGLNILALWELLLFPLKWLLPSFQPLSLLKCLILLKKHEYVSPSRILLTSIAFMIREN